MSYKYELKIFKGEGGHPFHDLAKFMSEPGIRVESVTMRPEKLLHERCGLYVIWCTVPFRDRDAGLIQDLQEWVNAGNSLEPLLKQIATPPGQETGEVLRVPESVGFCVARDSLVLNFGDSQCLYYDLVWMVGALQREYPVSPRLVECQVKDLKPGDWVIQTGADIKDQSNYGLMVGEMTHFQIVSGFPQPDDWLRGDDACYKLVLDE